MIRQLPAGFALVIRGGCAPVIARLPRAWNNPAYRRARRRPRPGPALPGPVTPTGSGRTRPHPTPGRDGTGSPDRTAGRPRRLAARRQPDGPSSLWSQP